MIPFDTVDTTRIPTDSSIEMSVAVSRMQWPKPGMKKAPNAIILVPTNDFPYAFAASSLVHDPIMGDLTGSTPSSPPKESLASKIGKQWQGKYTKNCSNHNCADCTVFI